MVKFGVVLPIYGREVAWESVLKYAEVAEKLGWDSLWISDHLLNPYLEETDVPDYFRQSPYALEVWTVLSALAAVTTKCRLGTYVICNNFRHPSILAKMATTLDIVSKGRLELAMGAGWLKKEHVDFGFWWDKHSLRIERLKEAVRIIKKLWTENDVSYHENISNSKTLHSSQSLSKDHIHLFGLAETPKPLRAWWQKLAMVGYRKDCHRRTF